MLGSVIRFSSTSLISLHWIRTMSASNTSPNNGIEVERKFVLGSDCEARLKELNATQTTEKSFTDCYYDNDDCMLVLADHWLRCRQDKWELKCPPENHRSHQGAATQYAELDSEPEIVNRLRKVFKDFPLKECESIEDALKGAQCSVFAKYETHRKSYQLDGFTVDLDMTDFGFSVGEIEKVVMNEAEISEAVAEIDGIAKRLGVTSTTRMPGKMSMYLYRFRPEIYQHLLKHAAITQVPENIN